MSGPIQIERLMHRSSIAVAGESAAAYCLIKLCPDGPDTETLPLSIALVLDVSGSMYGEDGVGISRLQRIQNAALAAISKLKPEDTLAVVAFAHDAQIVLPPTPLADRVAVEDVIRRIDSLAVDPGGTAMDQGIALGLQEVEKGLKILSVARPRLMAAGESGHLWIGSDGTAEAPWQRGIGEIVKVVNRGAWRVNEVLRISGSLDAPLRGR